MRKSIKKEKEHETLKELDPINVQVELIQKED